MSLGKTLNAIFYLGPKRFNYCGDQPAKDMQKEPLYWSGETTQRILVHTKEEAKEVFLIIFKKHIS